MNNFLNKRAKVALHIYVITKHKQHIFNHCWINNTILVNIEVDQDNDEFIITLL